MPGHGEEKADQAGQVFCDRLQGCTAWLATIMGTRGVGLRVRAVVAGAVAKQPPTAGMNMTIMAIHYSTSFLI